MDRNEVLEQAIQKAVINGLTGYWADRYQKCKELDEMEFLIAGNIYEEGHSPEELIYNHDFAKALWGEYPLGLYRIGTRAKNKKLEIVDERWESPWQSHLQNMVISEDPIEYLAKNL